MNLNQVPYERTFVPTTGKPHRLILIALRAPGRIRTDYPFGAVLQTAATLPRCRWRSSGGVNRTAVPFGDEGIRFIPTVVSFRWVMCCHHIRQVPLALTAPSRFKRRPRLRYKLLGTFRFSSMGATLRSRTTLSPTPHRLSSY